MQVVKKVVDLGEFEMTILVRKKSTKKVVVPKADNDNLEREFWSDEVKEFYDKYLEK